MKRICCMVLALISFQVYGMRGNFLLFGGGSGGGYTATFKYEEELNMLSKHEKLWRDCGPGLTMRAGATSFYAWQELREKIEKIASFANSENVNHRDAQGRTILHWVAKYGTNSDLEFLKNINGLCPLQMSNKGLLPCMLVPENKRDMRQLLDTLGRSHNSCPLCL